MGWYVFLADLVVIVHVAFVSFVLFGQLAIVIGLLCRWKWVRNPWFRILHLLSIGIVVAESVCSVRCPLTVWEDNLREWAGVPVEGASFMGRLMHNVLFYELDESTFTLIYLAFGSAVLLTFVFGPPRFKSRKPAGPKQLPVPETLGSSRHRDSVTASTP